MLGKTSLTISMFLASFLLSFGAIFFTKTTTFAETLHNTEPISVSTPQEKDPIATGNHVVIFLERMEIELRFGTTTIKTLPILSKGKPESYYETIGGFYRNDYKTPLHFSSIGHVYMPYSVHVFGNYFIHGVPYYPNGDKVSSAYSGGCIRLHDEDAKVVYDFIEHNTPIIITKGDDTDFAHTATTSQSILSADMTNYMVATISLEVLTQDTALFDTRTMTETTRRKLLPQLILNKDTNVTNLYTKSIGEEAFVRYMNEKAEAIGLSRTYFTSSTEPVITTYDDYMRFMAYITTYKSYLRALSL
ncbi:MAG: hypothetical protein RLZZ308_382 [Candidatus Parcubacteria bacterium]|jgi:hypothetical protein